MPKNRLPVTLGFTNMLPRSGHGYDHLQKNVTKVGSRLRMVTLASYSVRFSVTHGFVNRLHIPVPGYVWLRKLVTWPDFRLHTANLTLKKCVTDRFHSYARNRVTVYADPCLR